MINWQFEITIARFKGETTSFISTLAEIMENAWTEGLEVDDICATFDAFCLYGDCAAVDSFSPEKAHKQLTELLPDRKVESRWRKIPDWEFKFGEL